MALLQNTLGNLSQGVPTDTTNGAQKTLCKWGPFSILGTFHCPAMVTAESAYRCQSSELELGLLGIKP